MRLKRLLRIVAAEVCGPHSLRLRFSDGVTKRVNLLPELWGPICKPLLDPVYFARFDRELEHGTPEWPNGASFAPEFLHELPEETDPPTRARLRRRSDRVLRIGRRGAARRR